MSTPTSVEQIVNQALDRIGWPEKIGNIREGTKQARVALDVYSQTRDQLLRQADWDFSEKVAAGVLLGPAPAPWNFIFQYPADCLRLRSLFGTEYLADKNNPISILSTIANDAGAGGKVIYTTINSATLVYTKRVTDVTQWEPLFVESLIVELALRLGPALAALGPDAVKLVVEEDKAIIPLAEGRVG